MTTYIYALCCPDTQEIRYIGKANDPQLRLRKHLQASANPENYAQRWMAKLLRSGKKPTLIYLRRVLPEENWQEIERAAIASGFAEGLRLTNTSAGGEGVLVLDPELEAARKANCKATWQRPETKAAQSARQKIIQNRPAAIEANRARMLEKWQDPEYAALNSRRVSEAYSTPEARRAQSLRTLEANTNPDVVAARRAGIQAAWSDPDKKEKWIASLTAAQNTPEATASKSAHMKARHKDPDYREKMRKVMSDPEMIKRRNLAISAAKQRKKAEKLAALSQTST